MKFKTWLAAERGRAVLVALHFDVSQGAVSQWAKDGVPLARMKALQEFTEGAVRLEDMVPDPDQAPAGEQRATASSARRHSPQPDRRHREGSGRGGR